MSEKKQSRAAARKSIASLPSWTDKYGKMTPKRLTVLGLERRSYMDVIGEMSILRGMIVRPEFVISPAMGLRNQLAAERLYSLEYGIKRMTPVCIDVAGVSGQIGGTDAFRPLPNRSVVENSSGRNKQLGTPRRLFEAGICKCGREVGLDVMHWKGGRSSLCCKHVIPECFGGSTNYNNVVIGCSECNYQEGTWLDNYTMYTLRQIRIVAPINLTHPL